MRFARLPSDVLDRVRGWDAATRMRRLVGGALLLSVVVAVALTATRSGEPDTLVATIDATPSPTPTVAPKPAPPRTPVPTPEADPNAPVPAELVALGDAAGLSNPSSIGFSPPPAAGWMPAEPNTAGVRRIVAPALGIDHAVDTLGVTNGQLDSPGADEGSHSVGWYTSSGGYEFGVPANRGNSIFSAHETWDHMQGPFYRLHEVRIGDDIYLDMENGERRRYQVTSIERYPTAQMPMAEVLWPTDRPEEEEWITLYTCGGEIIYGDDGFGDYLARDVVVAKWVGSSYPPLRRIAEALSGIRLLEVQ